MDPRRQVEHLARVFHESAVLPSTYSAAQIEQGFWFMFVTGQFWFMDPLWDPTVPWPAREATILAIPNAYSEVFERHAIGTAPFMLWDLLARGLDRYPGRPPRYAGEDERVRDAMFQALRTKLRSPHADTQKAALHGLFHIEHPNGAETIRAWLSSTADVNESTRRYAEIVLAGGAL